MFITFFKIIVSKRLKKEKNAENLSFLILQFILTHEFGIRTEYDTTRT